MRLILFLSLVCGLSFGQVNAEITKEAGYYSIARILKCLGNHHYPGNFIGASTHYGPNSDKLVMHLADGQSTVEADAALAAVALPTASTSGLDITINFGTYIVNDATSIVADGSDTKFVRVDVEIDNATGNLEVIVYQKTTQAYASRPQAGNSICTSLMEYSVPASGSSLTVVNDWIR